MQLTKDQTLAINNKELSQKRIEEVKISPNRRNSKRWFNKLIIRNPKKRLELRESQINNLFLTMKFTMNKKYTLKRNLTRRIKDQDKKKKKKNPKSVLIREKFLKCKVSTTK